MLLAIAYLKWLREGNVRMTFNSSTCSRLPRRLMTTLTQYGMMAEKHWREFLPKMVVELEAKGMLDQALLEAEEKTDEELDRIRRQLIQQGLTTQQAHDSAWETVRTRYIFLQPES
jgi:hypothetical protein